MHKNVLVGRKIRIFSLGRKKKKLLIKRRRIDGMVV